MNGTHKEYLSQENAYRNRQQIARVEKVAEDIGHHWRRAAVARSEFSDIRDDDSQLDRFSHYSDFDSDEGSVIHRGNRLGGHRLRGHNTQPRVNPVGHRSNECTQRPQANIVEIDGEDDEYEVGEHIVEGEDIEILGGDQGDPVVCIIERLLLTLPCSN
ncbi:hypothetical protein QYF36_024829 [Acer negundo]|nr:hypothetical protein QYF36_024829 [Acer negundo]